jgi:hypothetical protein
VRRSSVRNVYTRQPVRPIPTRRGRHTDEDVMWAFLNAFWLYRFGEEYK